MKTVALKVIKFTSDSPAMLEGFTVITKMRRCLTGRTHTGYDKQNEVTQQRYTEREMNT